MDEISTWFENEFGHLGFQVTPIMHSPYDFTPIRGVLWRRADGAYIRANINISIGLTNDMTSSYNLDPVLEYKSLLMDAVNYFLESQNYEKDFKPKKRISKLKL